MQLVTQSLFQLNLKIYVIIMAQKYVFFSVKKHPSYHPPKYHILTTKYCLHSIPRNLNIDILLENSLNLFILSVNHRNSQNFVGIGVVLSSTNNTTATLNLNMPFCQKRLVY